MPHAARAALSLAALSALGAALIGCATTVKDDDTAAGTCTAICVGELTLSAADGRDDFGLSIYGDGFTSLQIGCPDNITLGGPAGVSAECAAGGAVISAAGVDFPDPLYVTASIGADFTGEQEFSLADFQIDSLCGTTCRTGALTFELPETGR